jgi:hypothetical protein
MQETVVGQERPAWTWADQVSTYRFWGLLIFFYGSAVSLSILTSFLGLLLNQALDLPVAQTGVTLAVLAAGGLFGFYLAWATVRSRAKALLIAAGLIQLAGTLLLTIPALAAAPALRFVGAFLVGLGAGTIALAVPSVLAAGRGGAEAFVLAFGTIFLMSRIGALVAPTSVGQMVDISGFSALAVMLAVWLVIGLIFLLPVKAVLFEGAPGPRGHALAPAHRSPWAVALLCLVPFYWLYWLYRAHGEVATLAPSRAILSPRAAVLAGLFVAPLFPVIPASLADALNKGAAEQGRPALRRPWVVVVWSLLCYPVAFGLLQASMNRAQSDSEPSAASASV